MSEVEYVSGHVSSQMPKLPQEFHLPYLAPYKADLKKRQASVELSMQHIFFKKKLLQNTWEWEELAQKKEKLKQLFIDSNKSVNENKASIVRFFEIIKEQSEQKVKIEQETLDTQIKIDEYKEVLEKMEYYVKQYSVFEQFLEKVAKQPNAGELSSVGEILNRYETLEATRDDLIRILEQELKAGAQLKKQMLQLMEEKSTCMKALDNHLVMLQVAHRQAQDRRIGWEMTLQRVKNKVIAGQEETMELQGACRDFYLEVCRRRGVHPSAESHDVESQLDYIQKSIMFYKEVLTIATGGGHQVKRTVKRSITKKKKLKELSFHLENCI